MIRLTLVLLSATALVACGGSSATTTPDPEVKATPTTVVEAAEAEFQWAKCEGESEFSLTTLTCPGDIIVWTTDAHTESADAPAVRNAMLSESVRQFQTDPNYTLRGVEEVNLDLLNTTTVVLDLTIDDTIYPHVVSATAMDPKTLRTVMCAAPGQAGLDTCVKLVRETTQKGVPPVVDVKDVTPELTFLGTPLTLEEGCQLNTGQSIDCDGRHLVWEVENPEIPNSHTAYVEAMVQHIEKAASISAPKVTTMPCRFDGVDTVCEQREYSLSNGVMLTMVLGNADVRGTKVGVFCQWDSRKHTDSTVPTPCSKVIER